ncbi:hypothetical protein [Pelagicoccus sp. SDUM812002]|uniref:hypothetical protein n=1 Tax=Pelagicoccus sp. SDUM812002 TaxID=3041266 RepID=UPI00280FAACB|nr:hypothetical protein [Pelagicoccus sp. SDUM812002]MDQ8184851.1 hypothetical protein [Pelagicoccus sp. SDUM812002]
MADLSVRIRKGALATLVVLSPYCLAQTESVGFEAPTTEVVFVLDTTGSMSGLIDGAKKKIWQFSDKLKDAKPTPNIKFGLIG